MNAFLKFVYRSCCILGLIFCSVSVSNSIVFGKMVAAWPLLLVVLVLMCSAAASTEELQPPDIQILQDGAPGAPPYTVANTKDTFPGAAAGECNPLNGDCPQQASGEVDPQQPPTDESAAQPRMAVQEALDMDEDLWRKKTIADRSVANSIIDDDDAGDDEEYYEGSSVSAGGDHESVQGAVAAPPVGATAGATVDTAAPALDDRDGQNVQGEGGSNTTTGEQPRETEKKKVPLREILLRLKPASLMDDEEREAAAAATAADRGDQDGNATTAGLVDSRSLALGGGHPSEDSTSSNTSKKAVCAATATEEGVQLLNATGLQALVSPNANSTGRSLPAPCLMVFFFSPRCRFSTTAAPAMTALARALQGVMPVYGVDSVQYHSINAQFGVIGTPQLVLFHNGYSVAHYNASSFTPDLLTSFLHHYTDYRMLEDMNITEEDVKEGPLPLKASPGGGWWLAASWLLLGGVASRCFVKSALCHRLVEAVLNSWREAEAQHQHQD